MDDRERRAQTNPAADQMLTERADPMTDKQGAFLGKLAQDKNVDVDMDNLNKARASELIDDLKSGRLSNAHESPSTGSKGATGSPQANASETIRDPSEWTTGGEPATKKQKAYIAVLEKRAGEPVHGLDGATKAEASERIEALREKTGE